MAHEVSSLTKLATAGWMYATWRVLSESGGIFDSYTLGFASELFSPVMAGSLARVGTMLLSRGGPAKHVAHLAALGYLGYEMDFNTVSMDAAMQYFGGDPEWYVEKPSNLLLLPLIASLYGAGYVASSGAQYGVNAFRSHLEKKEAV
ncbi:MAG: hypothetical protein NBV63_00840 [Candidatus Pacebacteria bacterium]|nr:hypothetical protein [Candidatus Paceibacterota bacterium]